LQAACLFELLLRLERLFKSNADRQCNYLEYQYPLLLLLVAASGLADTPSAKKVLLVHCYEVVPYLLVLTFHNSVIT